MKLFKLQSAVLPGLLLAAALALQSGLALAGDASPAAVASAPATAAAPANNAVANSNTPANATQPPATGNPASGMLASDTGGGLMRSVLGLVIVLSLIGGLAWLGRKFGNRVGGSKSNVLKTVAALAVGQRENVVVVELGEQWLVLGVAPGRVNTLAQLPSQELPQAEAQAGAKAFAQLLARARREERKS